MVVYEVMAEHEGTAYQLEFDSDSGLEVLKFQLYSLTMVPPENQTIIDSSKVPIENDDDILAKLESSSGIYTVTLVDKAAKRMHGTPLSEIERADEKLTRFLQAEEEALFLKQQANEHGDQEFASRLETYVNQVLQYEDPLRQAKARETVKLEELEEKALVTLAKEGKRKPSMEELEHYILLQLLLWFKESFRWVNSAPCFLCGADTIAIGAGNPTREEQQFGGDRVELFRCKSCRSVTRFPRYNDTLKLLETRSGRCGEWANCFTLYCRAFGYQARLVLDFTDHLWTECFSRFHGRWIHLDPCEGAFDKPLLYEKGWKKKLSYLIALSRDGVFDVTKRYTRCWKQVQLRRTLTSEENVAAVIGNLTARLRSTFSQDYLKRLTLRDAEEASELARSQDADKMSLEALPGRQTGSTEWRKARGELGSSSLPLHTMCPKRPCVDHFVSQIFLALGELHHADKERSSVLKDALEALLNTLKMLRKASYKARQYLFRSNSVDASLLPAKFFETNQLQRFFEVLGLVTKENSNDQLSSTALDPVDTALALPVAIENLESIIYFTKNNEGSDALLKQLTFYAEHERLCGAWAEASDEELCGKETPFGIASAAFDGLYSTKWEEPNGSKGGWLAYYLPSNNKAQVHFYELISANDHPERDPKDWALEGSNDGGCTWTVLDTRKSQLFRRRFERKCYEVSMDIEMLCNAFRLRFLDVRDSSSQSRLQLSCVNFYKKKQVA